MHACTRPHIQFTNTTDSPWWLLPSVSSRDFSYLLILTLKTCLYKKNVYIYSLWKSHTLIIYVIIHTTTQCWSEIFLNIFPQWHKKISCQNQWQHLVSKTATLHHSVSNIILHDTPADSISTYQHQLKQFYDKMQ